MKMAVALVASILLTTPMQAIAQRRLAPVETWFAGATSTGPAGFVTVRIGIGPDGQVARCEIGYSRASATLQAQTCAIVREQARYRPAGGNARPQQQDTFTIAWSGTPLTPAISSDFGGAMLASTQSLVSDLDYNADVARVGEVRLPLRFAIGADGRVRDCEAVRTSGSEAVDSYSCRLISARARFRMPLDEAGRPFATEGLLTIVWHRPPR